MTRPRRTPSPGRSFWSALSRQYFHRQPSGPLSLPPPTPPPPVHPPVRPSVPFAPATVRSRPPRPRSPRRSTRWFPPASGGGGGGGGLYQYVCQVVGESGITPYRDASGRATETGYVKAKTTGSKGQQRLGRPGSWSRCTRPLLFEPDSSPRFYERCLFSISVIPLAGKGKADCPWNSNLSEKDRRYNLDSPILFCFCIHCIDFHRHGGKAG